MTSQPKAQRRPYDARTLRYPARKLREHAATYHRFWRESENRISDYLSRYGECIGQARLMEQRARAIERKINK